MLSKKQLVIYYSLLIKTAFFQNCTTPIFYSRFLPRELIIEYCQCKRIEVKYEINYYNEYIQL